MLREHRRQAILRAARKVFAEKGYHATGVADIIAEAGIARGTFYLYFDGKRHVFETLLNDFLDLLRSRVKRIDETVGLSGIYSQLRENVTGVLAAFAENPELTRIILYEAVGLDKGFDAKLEEFYQGLMGMIEDSLRLGQEMGIVRPLDTTVVAAAILGSVKEVVGRIFQGGFKGEVSHLVDELLTYNIRALFVPDLLSDHGSLWQQEVFWDKRAVK